MKTPFALLATAAALLITTGAAHADVLPSNASISYDASIDTKGLDWDAPGKLLRLQQFNPQLGTLNAVSFSWSGQLTTRLQLTNTADDPNTIGYTVTGGMGFALPWATTIRQAFGSTSGQVSLAVDEVALTPSILFDLVGGSVVQGSLAPYIGEDNLEVWITAEGITAFSDDAGNFDYSARPKASAWVQVTYDYATNTTAVPEPGALGLLGLALAAAGIASRRRA
jgi:PEP-CTERM motif